MDKPTNIVANTRRHDIVFRANGRIDIMARAAKILGIQNGDAVNICSDGSRECYLYVFRRSADMVGNHACRCHRTHPGSHVFRLNSVALASHMLSLCGSPQKAAFWCGEPVTDPDGTIKLPIIHRINVLSDDLRY